MLWSNTNWKLEEYFEQGKLPTMVYINKQNYDRKLMQRPLHKHESICEVVFLYHGSGIYSYNEKTFYCQEGSVLFYNQGDLHELASATQNEVGSYSIGIANLRKKGMKENCLFSEEEPCVRQAGNQFPLIEQICEHIYHSSGNGGAEDMANQLFCAALIILASNLEEKPEKSAKQNDAEHMIRRIRRYLDQHFTEDISIGMVADDLGCSETYVYHLFKRVTGQTPMQYVIRRRIGLAQTLLISTELTVTEIAANVGYINANYFSTLFSKMVGMSPVNYRRQYKAESRGIDNQIKQM